jgi:hypothetical protein
LGTLWLPKLIVATGATRSVYAYNHGAMEIVKGSQGCVKEVCRRPHYWNLGALWLPRLISALQ